MEKENHFSSKMIDKTDSELKHLVLNKTDFQEDAVLAAIWELEKRDLKTNDVKEVESQIAESQLVKIERQKDNSIDSNITEDPNAPILYPLKQVKYFGVFFSVFAGSILLAMNLNRLGERKSATLVLISAIFYTITQIYILNLIDTRSYYLTFPVCLLGMYLLESIFWDNNVTKDLKYRKRNIGIPVLIGLAITIPFMLLVFYALVNEL